MKTRQLTLIGTVLALSALSIPFIISETAPKPEIPKTPNLELIDELVDLGCTEPSIDHLLRASNLLDDSFDGTYLINAIGYPDDLSKVELEKCVKIILERRTVIELENKTSTETGAYELDEVLCLGGRGMILNEKCERIGKYDIQTGIPIVENKVQCDLLNGTWYDDKNKCDSKYAPVEYRLQFGYSFLGYDVPQICTYDMMIHLARYSSMFDIDEEYAIEDIGLPENVNLNDYDVCVDELLKLRSMYEEK